MARGIRLLKAEREFLKALLGPSMDYSHRGKKAVALAESILTKVEESESKAKGVPVAPIEEALIAAARGKVLQLDPAAYGRASRMAEAVKATPEDAKRIGAWMARQGWLNQEQTLLDVLNKWYQWLPKARATEPPPPLPAGLGPAGKPDADTRQGTGTPGQAHPPGRSTPGFR